MREREIGRMRWDRRHQFVRGREDRISARALGRPLFLFLVPFARHHHGSNSKFEAKVACQQCYSVGCHDTRCDFTSFTGCRISFGRWNFITAETSEIGCIDFGRRLLRHGEPMFTCFFKPKLSSKINPDLQNAAVRAVVKMGIAR